MDVRMYIAHHKMKGSRDRTKLSVAQNVLSYLLRFIGSELISLVME